jgi:hypothetical protein
MNGTDTKLSPSVIKLNHVRLHRFLTPFGSGDFFAHSLRLLAVFAGCSTLDHSEVLFGYNAAPVLRWLVSVSRQKQRVVWGAAVQKGLKVNQRRL